jgi:hypothetical protein
MVHSVTLHTDFPKAFFTFKMSHGFTGHAEINFIYVRKKRTAFPVPIFTKLTNAQQHHVLTSKTEFHQNRTRRGILYVWGRGEVHSGFWWEDVKEIDHL